MKKSQRNVLLHALAVAAVLASVNSLAVAQSEVDLVAAEEQAIRDAVSLVAPSVVRIETFGGLEKVGRVLVNSGPTTGLIVSKDGFIISSAFNFIQQPASILVTLSSGKRHAAKVVASDDSRKLVCLKIEPESDLPVPTHTPLNEMQVGQWTVAVGRTFDAKVPNISVGVMSALGRIWGRAVQTDAKISPSNYGGPLVDVRGRVLGVLVPLSPQQTGEVAGAEWYDSGIGFAVPLAGLEGRLEQLKAGEDLKSGLLGITLKGKNDLIDPAEVAALHPKSPARQAGLKPGDTIVEFNGQQVVRLAQLKHAIGPLYGGDDVHLVARRGEDKVEFDLKLASELEPYEHPFLGILPMRDEAAQVVVRYVFPGSPADEAGIAAGDRITKINEKPVPDAAEAQAMIAVAGEPATKVKIEFVRGEATKTVAVTLAALPTELPGQLPAARKPAGDPPQDRPEVGLVSVKLPDEPNDCYAIVPQNYDPAAAYGLVVWLHPPGKYDEKQLDAQWKEICEKHELIVLAPKATNPARWTPTEVDFVKKSIEHVSNTYSVDETRVVTHGYSAGGAMAFLTAFSARDSVRGVAVVDAPIPARVQPPNNDPLSRLAILFAFGKESSLFDRIDANVEQLRKMKFPVVTRELDGKPRPLNKNERDELGRWIDTLDRI